MQGLTCGCIELTKYVVLSCLLKIVNYRLRAGGATAGIKINKTEPGLIELPTKSKRPSACVKNGFTAFTDATSLRLVPSSDSLAFARSSRTVEKIKFR